MNSHFCFNSDSHHSVNTLSLIKYNAGIQLGFMSRIVLAVTVKNRQTLHFRHMCSSIKYQIEISTKYYFSKCLKLNEETVLLSKCYQMNCILKILLKTTGCLIQPKGNLKLGLKSVLQHQISVLRLCLSVRYHRALSLFTILSFFLNLTWAINPYLRWISNDSRGHAIDTI